jgi:hypothetical protein
MEEDTNDSDKEKPQLQLINFKMKMVGVGVANMGPDLSEKELRSTIFTAWHIDPCRVWHIDLRL